jgi:YD repeat-containing protein
LAGHLIPPNKGFQFKFSFNRIVLAHYYWPSQMIRRRYSKSIRIKIAIAIHCYREIISMNIKIFTLYLFLFAGCINLLAQDAGDQIDFVKNVIPPSPNSASLGKYGDWPVGLYTGVPNISIPLTSVQGRTVSVPITLGYHASGVRVTEIASWVGLGWSLNAGGVISRSIRGLKDEDGLFMSPSFYTNPNDLSTVLPGNNFGPQRKVATAKGEMDSEQDVYNFSAMGRSYRLVLFADGSVQTIPRSNIKFISNPIIGPHNGDTWIVLLEDGTKLQFGDSFNETTRVIASALGGGTFTYTSSWQLQTITSITGETINFTYVSTDIDQDSFFSETDFIKIRTGTNAPANCVLVENSLGTKTKVSRQTVTTFVPSMIESDLMRVEFITSPNRSDLEGAPALSGMKVYYKLFNKYIEDYVFTTTYTTSVHSNEMLDPGDESSFFNKRLRLTAVERKNIDHPSAQSQKWTFDYHSQNLPSRRSYAQDHWGYFNGKTSNGTLLPREYFQLPASPEFDYLLSSTGFMPSHHEEGADRFGNEKYMKAESLVGIHYPTGGYSVFNYEPNSIPKTKEIISDQPIGFHMYVTAGQNPFINSMSSTFTLTHPSYVEMTLSGSFAFRDFSRAAVSVSVIDQAGNSVGGGSTFGTYWANILSAGTYTFKVAVNSDANNFTDNADYVDVYANLTYPKSKGILTVNELTGGLRVKSILNYDAASVNPVTAKYYLYANPLVIASVDTVRDYITTQASSVVASSGAACNFLNTIRNSSTKYVTGSIQGGTTAYGQVTVKDDGEGANGYTVSVFTNVPDDASLSDPHEFPYPPAMSMDHRRGLLTSEMKFNAQDVLIHQTENTYDFPFINQFMGYKAGYNELVDQSYCQNVFQDCGIVQGFYATMVEQVRHLTSTSTNFDTNGQNPLVSITNYSYTSSGNIQPTLVTVQDSEGSLIKSYSRTALEKSDINAATSLSSSASSAIDYMISKNMVSQVIQKETLKNNALISRSTSTYQLWNNNSMALPQKYQLQNGNSPAYDLRTVNNYDAIGNVIDLKDKDGVNKSYIWDFNKSKPIAEVINASQTEVAFTSFEGDGSGNWIISDNTVNSAAAFTGNACLSLTSKSISFSGLDAAKTYLVSLWAQPGAIININGAVSGSSSRNGWNYYQKTLTSTTSITVTGSGNIDDIRLAPVGAAMTTFTFGPFGVTNSSDANYKNTSYEYDGLGRLAIIRDHNGNVVTTNKYHYRTNAQ